MTSWIKYPEIKPAASSVFKDFLILIDNPFFINKPGAINRSPRFWPVLATWQGSGFLDFNGIRHDADVRFYMPVPKHPEELQCAA